MGQHESLGKVDFVVKIDAGQLPEREHEPRLVQALMNDARASWEADSGRVAPEALGVAHLLSGWWTPERRSSWIGHRWDPHGPCRRTPSRV